jgi:hypothetical protein
MRLLQYQRQPNDPDSVEEETPPIVRISKAAWLAAVKRLKDQCSIMIISLPEARFVKDPQNDVE